MSVVYFFCCIFVDEFLKYMTVKEECEVFCILGGKNKKSWIIFE